MTMKILQEVRLDDGTSVVVRDVLGDKQLPADEANRNVYRVDRTGAVIWQVRVEPGIYEVSPFTGLQLEADTLKAYRWDGVEYVLDRETGEAVPMEFVR